MSSKKSASRLKLKPKPELGYTDAICAGLNCNHPSDIIDATGNTWPFNVPLCDQCAVKRPPPPHRIEEVKPEPESVKEVEEPDKYEMNEYTKIKARTVAEVEGVATPKSVKLFG